MGMVKVTCQDCGREIEFNDLHLPSALERGDLVKGFTRTQKVVNDINSDGSLIGTQGEMDDYHEKLFDICKRCRALSMPRPGDEEVLRERRIQHKIRVLHEMRPDLDLEQRCHLAVEEEFDPKYETNVAFRDYLMELQGL